MGIIVWGIIKYRFQAIGWTMLKRAHFVYLQSLLHSMKDIPGSVRASTVIGWGGGGGGF